MFGKGGVNTSNINDMFGHGFGFESIFDSIFNHRNPFNRQQHQQQRVEKS